MLATNVQNQIKCAKTMIEASASENAEKWRQAGDNEISKLKEHNVYDLVELPNGTHLIGNW